MNLSQAVNSYISAKIATNVRQPTLTLYSVVFGHFLSHCRESSVVDSRDLGIDHIHTYLAARRRKVQASTLRTELAVLRGFLTWLTANGHHTLNWREALPRVRRDRSEARFLTEDECARLIAATRSICRRYHLTKTRDLAMVCLLLDTGLRKGELLRLKLSDFDWKDHSVRVSASSKSRRERRVWFGDRTMRALKTYLAERGIRFEQGRPLCDPETDVWVSRSGKPMHPATAWSAIKEIAEVAGLDDCHVHTLRHTNCSSLLANNMPLPDVMRLLGHADVRVTQRYVHVCDRDIPRRYRSACPVDRLHASGQ